MAEPWRGDPGLRDSGASAPERGKKSWLFEGIKGYVLSLGAGAAQGVCGELRLLTDPCQ